MEKIREEFEVWAEKQGCATERYSDDDHGYVFADTDECWNAWKASRAALCVELPQPELCDGAMVWYVDVEVALDEVGVSYK